MRTAIAGFTVLMMLASVSVSIGETIPVKGSEKVSNWSVNNDGGDIEISGGGIAGSSDASTLHLRFLHDGFEWGNAMLPVSLPPDAAGISFDLYVKSAASSASLFIWLMEEDGDGHLVMVKQDGKVLSEIRKGWRKCHVALTEFKLEPRGNKVQQILTTSKMLIGMNSGKADIYIRNLVFDTAGIGTSRTLAKTTGLKIVGGKNGRVAILKDSFKPSPGYSNPDVLASALTAHGYGVTFLKSGDVADSSILTKANFDCLVLPYGPCYPADAQESIKSYLKSGGSFLSTGGYAFDFLCGIDSSGNFVTTQNLTTAADIAKGNVTSKSLNTRIGIVGDTMGLNPDQIGVFDPSYHLKYVSGISSAPDQFVIPAAFKAGMSVKGYAASSLLGSNNPVFPEKWGRHITLVEGRDASGRERGPVGSMAMNYAGPYAGSTWAFFGVTDKDLFTKKSPLLAYLPSIMDALLAKTFLHSFGSDLACYNDGETVKLSCSAANLGRRDLSAQVQFSVFDRSGKKVYSSKSTVLALKHGSTEVVTSEFKPVSFTSDFYRIKADLLIDGKTVDTMESGFVSYDAGVVSQGFAMEFKDNYFHDKNRSLLLSGTNLTGAVFFSADENPLVWEKDLARMNENVLNVARILHFSPFVSSTPGSTSAKPLDLNIDKLPLKFERQFDAFMQLAQKHKVIVFLTAHDWMETALTDEELAAQRQFLKLLAERYKNMPGFMIDIQNEPHVSLPNASDAPVPITTELWNKYLRDKYKTDDALKSAWSISPPESSIGSIPYSRGSDAWNDMRTFDADIFRSIMINRWIKENYDGAKDGNPEVPVGVGFLPSHHYSLNKLIAVENLDFANMHSYSPIEDLRADFKLFDRRFQGKSVSQGEFGSLHDHDKRTNGLDNPDQDYRRYLQTGHYLFGEGGSFIANWCWKDMDGVVFPWGLNYTNSGPGKDLLKAYRNQSLLFRQVKPLYKPQEVFLVAPINTMLGGKNGYMNGVLYKYVDALLNLRADFGVIDDQHLDMLPSTAKLLVYPAAFSVPDKAYDQLKSFVNRGGRLCVTGDISYDDLRQRTKTDRLEDLLGVRFVSSRYDVGVPGNGPLIDVQPVTAKDDSGIYTRQMGSGRVLYSPDLMAGIDGNMLKNALQGLDNGVVHASAGHAFLLPGQDGSKTYVLVNPDASASKVKVNEPGASEIEVGLEPKGVGLVKFDKNNKLVAIEFQDGAKIGSIVIKSKGHFAIMAFDGKDILSSRELVILPFDGKEIDLGWLNNSEKMIVQSCDFNASKMTGLTESPASKISLPAGNAFDIHIVAAKDKLAGLRKKVASELELKVQ
ncbi:MAG: beta-galactosidase [Armatimonadota bacterium]